MTFRRLLRKLAISLASVTIAMVAFEVAARLAEPGPFALIDRNPFVLARDYKHAVHKPGFRGAWEGTYFDINSLGMRGPEFPTERSPGEYRVVCLGDSCTFGKGVVERNTWPRQLEQLLDSELAPERDAVVANLGTNSFAGFQYRKSFLDVGVGLDPDLVVVGYNLNDFPNVVAAVNAAVYKQRPLRKVVSREVRDALGRTATYRFLRALFYDLNRERDWDTAERFAGEIRREIDPQVWARQEKYLLDIQEAARGAGAELMVFLFPYESQVYRDSFDSAPIDKLREICNAADIAFVDLAAYFKSHAYATDPPRDLFIRGDRFHPTAESYGLVAERVVEEARRRGWL